MVERQQFFVYFNHNKAIKDIRSIAHITYVSEKQKYLVAYCDRKRFDGFKAQIEKLQGVTGVEASKLPYEGIYFDEFEPVK
jgi:uncharacterized protein YlbG (UPF0298 family)